MHFKVAAAVEVDVNIFFYYKKQGMDVGIVLIRPCISNVVTDGKQISARKFVKCGQNHILVAFLCPEDDGIST